MDSSERYLEQADFYRAVAKNARDLGTRNCLECVARSYRVLAESQKQLEQLAKAEMLLRQLWICDRSPPPRGELNRHITETQQIFASYG